MIVNKPLAKKRKLIAPSAPATPKVDSTLAFYLEDFGRTLFPLKTNRELITHGEDEVQTYIARCLDEEDKAYAFSSQRRVYGAKPQQHLRRTVKLDVVAEYYMYDVVFRNRARFRRPHRGSRTHYGYRFEAGNPIPATTAYKGFKGALSEYSKKYRHAMSLDVASYFNALYHHDLVSWFAELGAPNEDVEGFGQLLRQINSGRSVDCLPQGLYPTKMVGNDFLRFVDDHFQLRSSEVVRFMDDIYLFSDDKSALEDDFQVIQRLLGSKGLSVNPQKTRVEEPSHTAIDRQIDKAKASLLARRRFIVVTGYDENDEEIVTEMMVKHPLSDDELAYLTRILEAPQIEEEDAELILTIMREHASRVEKRLPYLIASFPSLTKSVYGFCGGVRNKELVADAILSAARETRQLMEFQLFWFAAILEDYLMETSGASALIGTLYDHPSATSITRAKILEIGDRRYGLQEMRDELLMNGQSDWMAWSSAVGSRILKKTSRNHKLKYFGNQSSINHLVSSIVLKID